jgi:hypothetical protein
MARNPRMPMDSAAGLAVAVDPSPSATNDAPTMAIRTCNVRPGSDAPQRIFGAGENTRQIPPSLMLSLQCMGNAAVGRRKGGGWRDAGQKQKSRQRGGGGRGKGWTSRSEVLGRGTKRTENY